MVRGPCLSLAPSALPNLGATSPFIIPETDLAEWNTQSMYTVLAMASGEPWACMGSGPEWRALNSGWVQAVARCHQQPTSTTRLCPSEELPQVA